jgi:hypothetical protein
MTAAELISGLRERGYTVLRSREPAWVIIPRLNEGDPMVPWLQEKGVRMRPYDPEWWSNPGATCYEAVLTSASMLTMREVWEAAA